jgi:hypothetical protein
MGKWIRDQKEGETIMKVFEYTYYDRWGAGQGIVIAESEEGAIALMREPYSADKITSELFPELVFEEIDVTKSQVIDHSWCE